MAAPAVFVRATVADLDALVPLVRDFYFGEHIPYDEARVRSAFCELIENPEFGSVWLIREEERLIGYFALTHGFILEFGGRHAVLDELYLVPAARGRGVGKAALAKVEEICRAAHRPVVRLEVDVVNARGQAMYTRAGFSRHERYTMTRVLE